MVGRSGTKFEIVTVHITARHNLIFGFQVIAHLPDLLASTSIAFGLKIIPQSMSPDAVDSKMTDYFFPPLEHVDGGGRVSAPPPPLPAPPSPGANGMRGTGYRRGDGRHETAWSRRCARSARFGGSLIPVWSVAAARGCSRSSSPQSQRRCQALPSATSAVDH